MTIERSNLTTCELTLLGLCTACCAEERELAIDDCRHVLGPSLRTTALERAYVALFLAQAGRDGVELVRAAVDALASEALSMPARLA